MGYFTDALVNKPAGFLQNKVAPKVRDYLSKHHGINVQGSNQKTMGSSFAAMFNEALKTGDTGYKSLDAIVNFFDLQEAAMGEKNTLWDKNALDLEKAGAALVLPEDDLNPNNFVSSVDHILLDEKYAKKMSEASKALGVPNASDQVIKVMKEISR